MMGHLPMLRYCIEREGADPTFKNAFGLSDELWGVTEHANIMKALKKLGEFDGVDPFNSAGIEVLLRRAQLIEYTYSERGPAAAARVNRSLMSKYGAL